MYMMPQEGDRIQDIGSDPAHGILLSVEYNDDFGMEMATVLWDDGRESMVNYEMIEGESWR
jgi:hypothetical protein